MARFHVHEVLVEDAQAACSTAGALGVDDIDDVVGAADVAEVLAHALAEVHAPVARPPDQHQLVCRVALGAEIFRLADHVFGGVYTQTGKAPRAGLISRKLLVGGETWKERGHTASRDADGVEGLGYWETVSPLTQPSSLGSYRSVVPGRVPAENDFIIFYGCHKRFWRFFSGFCCMGEGIYRSSL